MDTLQTLVARSSSDDGGLTPTTINLLISLLVLILFTLALIGAYLLIRRRRQARQQSELPLYNDRRTSNHRRLTITAGKSDSVYVIDEKRNLVDNSVSPPQSPVPEIRITFPEEEDAAGKRQSGRVVVVRISDKGGIGLEPYDEDLPPYQSNGSDRFQSLDLDRMGGLKENPDAKRWS
ncbi:hypothetical protein FQN55_009236 [Onygenales sp. PD_40]|nr:hypothetical protein FQN55_009236 [Onygenales sp. PD_40]KAK2782833.1 hypothetical protein FQN52_000558 [Onygenales sp. PD_12]KAK2783731.1 hypothetical protein FQN53_008997 [Emmonsiellopsis sp. PD_33]KAK2789183.1 hypothetical protein FQN51_002739 [Onygenales sp. PD_10]